MDNFIFFYQHQVSRVLRNLPFRATRACVDIQNRLVREAHTFPDGPVRCFFALNKIIIIKNIYIGLRLIYNNFVININICFFEGEVGYVSEQ